MNYYNYIGKVCVFIEYETEHAKGRMVIKKEYYDKISKKLMAKLKKCTITLFMERKFTYQDIDFIKKGSMNNVG